MMQFNTRAHFDSDGDNTAQAARTSGAYLAYLHVINANTAEAYIQLFDAVAGDVTVGTTTPALSLLVPPGDGVNAGAFEQQFAVPIHFRTALTYSCTTTATGNGDPSTGLTVNMVTF